MADPILNRRAASQATIRYSSRAATMIYPLCRVGVLNVLKTLHFTECSAPCSISTLDLGSEYEYIDRVGHHAPAGL